ncbi:hypothetical protein IPT12_21775 [Xanthomonas perforans]|uniref:Uncharacterized protein n=5 Tax=Xanthomonas TaxID=338 RepID=W4RXN3_9XANT|nr:MULTISPECIES: hypothetical protein [Xanthomonas]MEB1776544.1 hypothetical protein [Xanthomonas campestris pv. campestris]CEJ49096.1 hypothetical protein XAB3213_4920007 [Xanthomonas citri pv. bilvae]GAE49041.1 hypothetical protein XPU_0573 [Xanthomonas arboricola pv. pruni str. MAFF 311562]GAE53446.1 hypothetical protein XPR_0081 [Xanthomonas arboricola pv. pruni MAFF 301420]GAE59196.1 hypothetical protein XPN_1102 [Xanthomonas arboricola pv. pruni MAFF 301427]
MSSYLVACKASKYTKDGVEESKLTRVGAYFPFKESKGGRLVLDEGIAVFGELVLVEPRSQGMASD